MRNNIIKITESDNVSIIPYMTGLPKGTEINDSTRLLEAIAMGHKVSLSEIAEDDEIIRYGQVIGYAKTALAPGDWVQESKIGMPVAPELDSIPMPAEKSFSPAPLEDTLLWDTVLPTGALEQKNILGITTNVQCVAGLVQQSNPAAFSTKLTAFLLL